MSCAATAQSTCVRARSGAREASKHPVGDVDVFDICVPIPSGLVIWNRFASSDLWAKLYSAPSASAGDGIIGAGCHAAAQDSRRLRRRRLLLSATRLSPFERIFKLGSATNCQSRVGFCAGCGAGRPCVLLCYDARRWAPYRRAHAREPVAPYVSRSVSCRRTCAAK
jgi:hypothetical protein